MWLFILATYYYYCERMELTTYCPHNPPTGSTYRKIRLGNETQGSKIYYLCLSWCIYHENTNLYRPEQYSYIFQGFGVYDESIQAEGLRCYNYGECIWNYSKRTPQLTRTPMKTIKPRTKKTPPKINALLATELVFLSLIQ